MKPMIPFSPPRIDEYTIQAVSDVLRSGWITTGPKVKEFEKAISPNPTVCVSSWTMGATVVLNWLGIKEGDEVILPAFTYCATANVIIQSGAKPIFVDINEDDFNISIEAVRKAITTRTKAIIAVDIAGLPCDYSELIQLSKEHSHLFKSSSIPQEQINRITIISDAAHSFGSVYKGMLPDITIYSFHAVKNLTTAEGGAIVFNYPFIDVYSKFQRLILHGQNKSAFDKVNNGWRYDVTEIGFKCNMTDIQAAIGLDQLNKYPSTLARRKEIFKQYDEAFNEDQFIRPLHTTETKQSNFHLYQLRVKGLHEKKRDRIVDHIIQSGVSVNVHFKPVQMLTAYRRLGYNIYTTPEAYNKYQNEISLPVYFDLTDEQIKIIVAIVKNSIILAR